VCSSDLPRPRAQTPPAAPAARRSRLAGPARAISPAAEAPDEPLAPAGTAKRGLLSRLAGSMSKDAPGSLWKRLLLLVALFWGGYRGLKANWRRIAPLLGLGQQIVIPDAPLPAGQGTSPLEKSAPDWGPLITPTPSPAPGGQTGGSRG
jgi:hypothetical protein